MGSDRLNELARLQGGRKARIVAASEVQFQRKAAPGILMRRVQNKMNTIRFLLLSVLLMFPLFSVYSQRKPPARYVDRGACPFECCTYRQWKTEKDTVAYALPNQRSRRAGLFRAGSKVVGLTGEVRTIPGRFVILKPHDKYRPGDVLWVYTPRGEGFYKVWFKGRMYDEALDYMSGPFEQSHPRCDEVPDCWGRLETEIRVDWWVRIKSAAGWVGWTNETANFSNMDACG